MAQFRFSKEKKTDVVNPQLVQKSWNILIIDDDESIHQVTELVLGRLQVDGRQLKLHHAFSAAEARGLLQSEHTFCMAFVDVVMETDQAGLELVDWIRREKKDPFIRLVLRTGQPGSAPEEDVIRRYDINDYRTKTEFTALKMQTAVYVGIRGYRDIMTISRSLDAFKRLILSSTKILKIRDLQEFATAALENLLALLDLESSAVYIVRQETDYDASVRELILARSGQFGDITDCTSQIAQRVRSRIDQAFHEGQNELNEQYFVGYCRTSPDACSVLYIEFEDDPEHFNAALAEMYATTVALILESLTRQQQVERSQRELLYIVGEAVEARSKETGSHVKRVALMCRVIARHCGLPESFAANLQIAAPLHDVGKIAIPEHILHKPGKLDAQEWEIMKTHAEIGGNLVGRSDLPVAKLAARLAHYHHENWDGSGYPEGLAGETIPIEARIMALVDVIDALGSHRSYKEPWPAGQILAFIKEQSGLKFEPRLVDVASDCFDELMQIRASFPD
ncbi:HD domain-containing phosphohydrolase [Undibacterium squillarum]|uniref:Phosphodiesterase n=1 Tax=Undibacterium squillarum TaxID=1131567 RepID=A0ABQ2XVU1_9BURK|nr:HD domain-containing phosphohydrolase [Undibacterium squillarum]GGX36709.1 phosphodiesterase [Undibacterium squillarum]